MFDLLTQTDRFFHLIASFFNVYILLPDTVVTIQVGTKQVCSVPILFIIRTNLPVNIMHHN